MIFAFSYRPKAGDVQRTLFSLGRDWKVCVIVCGRRSDRLVAATVRYGSVFFFFAPLVQSSCYAHPLSPPPSSILLFFGGAWSLIAIRVFFFSGPGKQRKGGEQALIRH